MFEIDETFMECTLDDIKDSIEKLARSRAKKPKPIVTTLYINGRFISVTVAAS